MSVFNSRPNFIALAGRRPKTIHPNACIASWRRTPEITRGINVLILMNSLIDRKSEAVPHARLYVTMTRRKEKRNRGIPTRFAFAKEIDRSLSEVSPF